MARQKLPPLARRSARLRVQTSFAPPSRRPPSQSLTAQYRVDRQFAYDIRSRIFSQPGSFVGQPKALPAIEHCKRVPPSSAGNRKRTSKLQDTRWHSCIACHWRGAAMNDVANATKILSVFRRSEKQAALDNQLWRTLEEVKQSVGR